MTISEASCRLHPCRAECFENFSSLCPLSIMATFLPIAMRMISLREAAIAQARALMAERIDLRHAATCEIGWSPSQRKKHRSIPDGFSNRFSRRSRKRQKFASYFWIGFPWRLWCPDFAAPWESRAASYKRYNWLVQYAIVLRGVGICLSAVVSDV